MPKSLDKALIRPGRFDKKITLPLPSQREREKLLDYYLNKLKAVSPALDVKSLARMMATKTGADVKNLVNQAALVAIGRNGAEVKTQGSLTRLQQRLRQPVSGAEHHLSQGQETRALQNSGPRVGARAGVAAQPERSFRAVQGDHPEAGELAGTQLESLAPRKRGRQQARALEANRHFAGRKGGGGDRVRKRVHHHRWVRG